MNPRYMAAFGLIYAAAAVTPAFANRPARPALLPVPYSINEQEDPATFKRAPANVSLHEFVSFPGWVTAADFEALRQWLLAQGFVIVVAVPPKRGVTYPTLHFHGNAAKFDRAFHVTVMERYRGGWCYAVFTPLMMPSRFAPKGANNIEGYGINQDSPASRFGLSSRCH
jgi:hypothetical protein